MLTEKGNSALSAWSKLTQQKNTSPIIASPTLRVLASGLFGGFMGGLLGYISHTNFFKKHPEFITLGFTLSSTLGSSFGSTIGMKNRAISDNVFLGSLATSSIGFIAGLYGAQHYMQNKSSGGIAKNKQKRC